MAMRIRFTRPEFWRSERVASVDWDARFMLKALESYVDDNGVGKDDIALIAADCFPRDLTRDPSRTLARIPDALARLHEAGLLWRYSSDGTDLLFVAFWEQVQKIDRPSKGRLTRPDGTLHYGDSEIRESVANPREPSRIPREGAAPKQVSSEVGSRKQVARTTPTEPDGFDQFWDAYPRKEAKGKAREAYTKALDKTDPATLHSSALTYAKTKAGEETRFIKHPTTWLNQECWEDVHQTEPDTPTWAQIGHPDYDPNAVALAARS